MAWCIVPFDAKARGPVERAKMLQKLGSKRNGPKILPVGGGEEDLKILDMIRKSAYVGPIRRRLFEWCGTPDDHRNRGSKLLNRSLSL